MHKEFSIIIVLSIRTTFSNSDTVTKVRRLLLDFSFLSGCYYHVCISAIMKLGVSVCWSVCHYCMDKQAV